MMGRKVRACGPLAAVSLDDLVAADGFCRHLDRCLDLGLVRDLVRGAYAPGGRPSIDPVVFFKLQLVMFFEGIRSERKALETASLTWPPAGTSATPSTGSRPSDKGCCSRRTAEI